MIYLDNAATTLKKPHCVAEAVSAGDTDSIDDLCMAIDKFMK